MNYKSSSVIINQGDKKITLNGVEYDFPKGMSGCSLTTINNKVYIDGFELIDGKWKRTITALWHLFF